MKRHLLTFLLVFSILMLSGCSKKVEDVEVEVIVNGDVETGLFTGALKKGKPDQDGVIKFDHGKKSWEYQGEFREGTITGFGTVLDYPCEVEIIDNKYEGKYSGDIEDFIPQGEGSFTSKDVEFTGKFEEGDAITGTAKGISVSIGIADNIFNGIYKGDISNDEITGSGVFTDSNSGMEIEGKWDDSKSIEQALVSNYPIYIIFQDLTIHGLYTGNIIDGQTTGDGSFVDDEVNLDFNYKGTIDNNQLVGSGKLITDHYLAPTTINYAHYDGDVVDGIPSGYGKYIIKDAGTVLISYDGEWADGLFDGKGTLYKSSLNESGLGTMEGTFVKGDFTPTKSEYIKCMSNNVNFKYTAYDSALTFVDEHEDLFQAESKEKVLEYIDNDLEYKMLTKSPQKYSGHMIKLKNYSIISIDDVPSLNPSKECTIVIAGEGKWLSDVVFCIFPGVIDDIYSRDDVDIYGMFIDTSSYDNVSGGKTKCIVCYGSYIEKN